MAKTSMIEREKRRILLNQKYDKKRKELKTIISSLTATDDERFEAEAKLQKLPRDSSRTRQRHRCSQCGRPRSYNNLTGLCRIHMRTLVMKGWIPGMHKDSW
jgi:small subunit ribosomal protein S14